MTRMYLDLMKSLALWFESRGSSPKDALLRAAVALSMWLLAIFLSAMLLLTVLCGIPVANWVSDHSWSIWLVTLAVGLMHWPIALKLRRRDQTAEDLSESARPSRYLWCWYCVPVFALFIASVMIAIASSTH